MGEGVRGVGGEEKVQSLVEGVRWGYPGVGAITIMPLSHPVIGLVLTSLI